MSILFGKISSISLKLLRISWDAWLNNPFPSTSSLKELEKVNVLFLSQIHFYHERRISNLLLFVRAISKNLTHLLLFPPQSMLCL